MEKASPADKQPNGASEHAQLEKLERLEREYLRMTRTQTTAEVYEMHGNRETPHSDQIDCVFISRILNVDLNINT